MLMRTVPITFKEACEFISKFHRHHTKPQGWKFGIGAVHNGIMVGVVVVGRPVARLIDHKTICEVTRLCTDGTKNVCSFLYAAARRVAKELGYLKIITYILDVEHGVSLKASGWTFARKTKGGSWSRPSRDRVDKAPLNQKQLWESELWPTPKGET